MQLCCIDKNLPLTNDGDADSIDNLLQPLGIIKLVTGSALLSLDFVHYSVFTRTLQVFSALWTTKCHIIWFYIAIRPK
jgi:hypothetical protein